MRQKKYFQKTYKIIIHKIYKNNVSRTPIKAILPEDLQNNTTLSEDL
jgi:hypothetical protein